MASSSRGTWIGMSSSTSTIIPAWSFSTITWSIPKTHYTQFNDDKLSADAALQELLATHADCACPWCQASALERQLALARLAEGK